MTFYATIIGRVGWRLVSGNGRSIAVSTDQFADRAAALEALRTTCQNVDKLVPQATHANSAVQWSWTAVDPSGAPIAAAERVFGRYGTCLSAYGRFVETARELDGADLAELVRGTDGP